MARKRRPPIAQLAVMAAVVSLGWWAVQKGGYFRPLRIPRDQVYAHLPADRPERLRGLIRVPGVEADNPRRPPEFEIVIDPDGRPETVRLVPSNTPERMPPQAAIDSAVAQIRSWRFVPFEAKGQPVHALFVTEFTMVPVEDRPSVHISFPTVTDVSKVTMTYDEQGIRRLPRSVTIHGDGQIEIANTSVRSTQHFQATIPQDQVLHLIDAFRRADFFSLKQNYGGGPSDGTTRTVSITIDGQTKKVGDYEGQYGGLPDAVMELEENLQRAGGLQP